MKAPTNFKSNNVGGQDGFGNSSKGSMDKSVMSYPKNGLEAESRANGSKNAVNKNVLSVQEVSISGTPKGN